MAYYAWAPIDYGAEVDDKGNIKERKIIKVGEEVDQGKLGVDDTEWNSLISGGTVREAKYPLTEEEMKTANLDPPNVVLARRAAEMQESASQELPPSAAS
jgi:hypothetical protein